MEIIRKERKLPGKSHHYPVGSGYRLGHKGYDKDSNFLHLTQKLLQQVKNPYLVLYNLYIFYTVDDLILKIPFAILPICLIFYHVLKKVITLQLLQPTNGI